MMMLVKKIQSIQMRVRTLMEIKEDDLLNKTSSVRRLSTLMYLMFNFLYFLFVILVILVFFFQSSLYILKLIMILHLHLFSIFLNN